MNMINGMSSTNLSTEHGERRRNEHTKRPNRHREAQGDLGHENSSDAMQAIQGYAAPLLLIIVTVEYCSLRQVCGLIAFSGGNYTVCNKTRRARPTVTQQHQLQWNVITCAKCENCIFTRETQCERIMGKKQAHATRSSNNHIFQSYFHFHHHLLRKTPGNR